MSSFGRPLERAIGRWLPPWWLLLVTGYAWILVGLIVLRFDYTSVSAISILFGFVAIAAGVVEIGVTMLASGWWKLLSGLLAVAFIASGVISFIHPGDTFLALAAVISFFLVNITVTSLSIVVALVIGMIELLQVTVGLQVLDLGKIGYLVVALFFATWAVLLVYWKARRMEERWTA